MKIQNKIAIYIDLENIKGKIDLARLMKDIELKYSNKEKTVYAVKFAAGNEGAIRCHSKDLTTLNFDIRLTKHITNKKNRADLIITVDALETALIHQGDISLFVFIADDSDYSVVMDSLRKYDKDVWLVTRPNHHEILDNTTDYIINIDDYRIEKPKSNLQQNHIEVRNKSETNKHLFDLDEQSHKVVLDAFHVFLSYKDNKQRSVKEINRQLKSENVLIKNTPFKEYTNLYRFLKEQALLSIKKEKHKPDMIYNVKTRKIGKLVKCYTDT